MQIFQTAIGTFMTKKNIFRLVGTGPLLWLLIHLIISKVVRSNFKLKYNILSKKIILYPSAVILNTYLILVNLRHTTHFQ